MIYFEVDKISKQFKYVCFDACHKSKKLQKNKTQWRGKNASKMWFVSFARWIVCMRFFAFLFRLFCSGRPTRRQYCHVSDDFIRKILIVLCFYVTLKIAQKKNKKKKDRTKYKKESLFIRTDDEIEENRKGKMICRSLALILVCVLRIMNKRCPMERNRTFFHHRFDRLISIEFRLEIAHYTSIEDSIVPAVRRRNCLLFVDVIDVVVAL